MPITNTIFVFVGQCIYKPPKLLFYTQGNNLNSMVDDLTISAIVDIKIHP